MNECIALKTQFILILDTIDKLFEVIYYLIENNNNVKVRKNATEMLKKIKRKEEILTVVPVVNTLSIASDVAKVKKVKVKKTKKVTQSWVAFFMCLQIGFWIFLELKN